jgi:hypothetical protein
MQTQKYSIQQPLIESLLAWIKEGEIAIPEIQRPFVWDKGKVRDLMDTLEARPWKSTRLRQAVLMRAFEGRLV